MKKRQLTFWDCLGIGINGIIGTGIFLLPARVLKEAGSLAPFSWLLLGAVCILVALCFAEASSHTDRSGGPYRYAYDVFGPKVGFMVGWVTLVSTLFGYAAVASAFGPAVLGFLGIVHEGGAMLLSTGLVILLAMINLAGARFGGRTSYLISVVKVGGLLLFVLLGLWVLHGSHSFSSVPLVHENRHAIVSVGYGAFAGLFAITGFEYIPVPAGEVVNPKRNVPLAMVFSILGVLVLYILIQVVVNATASHEIINSEQNNAIVLSTKNIIKAWKGEGAGLLSTRIAELARSISIFGFCAGSALVGPRYLEVFAQDQFLPRALSWRSKQSKVPAISIIVLSLLVIAAIWWMYYEGGEEKQGSLFNKLSNLSNIAVLLQFVFTCASLLFLRKWNRTPKGGFSLPSIWGYIVPIFAIAGCLILLKSVEKNDWKYAMVAIFAGLGLAFFFIPIWAQTEEQKKHSEESEAL